MRLVNWNATPSGGAITINGTDQVTGAPVKLQHVKRIEMQPAQRFGPFRLAAMLAAYDRMGAVLAELA